MLNIEQLSFFYGRKRALKDVNFSAQNGDCIGVVGENGAGKTTLLKTLSGILPPTTGQVHFQNKDLYSNENLQIRSKFGVAIDDSILMPELQAFDYLQLSGIIYGVNEKDIIERSNELCEFLLGDVSILSQKIGAYSTGMKQKIMLIAALLHKPDFLLLDEPFSGLDPWSCEKVLVLLDHLRQNKIMVISSHDLTYLSKVCTHILFIDQGEIAYFKPMSAVLAESPSLEALILNAKKTKYNTNLISWL